jgi:hypothetical protein
MKFQASITSALLIAATAGIAFGQASPPAQAGVDIGGKNIAIKYSAPSVRGRKIFGGAGALQPDNTVWRAGANQATSLHTAGDLTIGSLNVPAGDYTLYVYLDPKAWQLIVSKQTGQWGINRDGSTSLDKSQELGRVPMNMSKPAAPVETYKMTLASTGGNRGRLMLEWENVAASVDFTVK